MKEEGACSTPEDDKIYQVLEQIAVVFSSHACQIFCTFAIVFVTFGVVSHSLVSRGRKSKAAMIVTSLTVSTLASLYFACSNLSAYYYEKKWSDLFFNGEIPLIASYFSNGQIAFVFLASYFWLMANAHYIFLAVTYFKEKPSAKEADKTFKAASEIFQLAKPLLRAYVLSFVNVCVWIPIAMLFYNYYHILPLTTGNFLSTKVLCLLYAVSTVTVAFLFAHSVRLQHNYVIARRVYHKIKQPRLARKHTESDPDAI